jgi:ribosomal protein S27AE
VEALGREANRLSETLGAKLLPEREATATEVRQLRGNWALGSALAVALSRAGWTTEAQPGEPVLLRGPAGTIDPFGAVQALVKGEMSVDAWAAECERLGIAGIEMLGTGPAPRRVVTSAEEAPRVAVHPATPAPVAAVSDTARRTRRCWRCKEPVELPAESGGERPRCGKCGTLQWVPV